MAAAMTAGSFALAPVSFRALPATFHIVDAQRQPIAGAIVLMDWAYWENSHYERVFLVFETESDSNGVVHVPGWGPLGRSLGAGVKGSAPSMKVFKPGYFPFFAQNVSGVHPALPPIVAPPLIKLKWDGEVVELTTADRDSPKYLSRVVSLSGSLPLNHSPDLCWRDSNRKMIDAVNGELRQLQYAGAAMDETDPNDSTCSDGQ